MWWRENHLSRVDWVLPTMEMDFNFPICDCQAIPFSHSCMVSGTNDIVVIDDRRPGEIYANIRREAGPCRAAWFGETDVIAIATQDKLVLGDCRGNVFENYDHKFGPIFDLQTTSTMAVVQVPEELSFLQINTRPLLLSPDLGRPLVWELSKLD
jgi:hypothetical protein